MSSIIPVAIVAGVWYHLARQGITTTTVWLGCNLLDTFRALRLIRPNGRAVGQRTRKRAMRDSLICWASFIAVQQVGGIPDKLLGWLPVYSLVRSLVVAGFLFARVSASEAIYTSLIQPTLRQYETPIDLSIEFIPSIVLLIYHFTLQYPLIRLRSTLKPYLAKLVPLFNTVKGIPTVASPLEVTTVDLTHIDDFVQPAENSIKAPVHIKTPSASRIQDMIQACEKRSPARSIKDDRPRSTSTRPTTSLRPAIPSTDNVTTRPVQRAKLPPSIPPAPVLAAVSRETARPTASRPRAPVKPIEAQRQPIARPSRPATKAASGVLTESRPAPTASQANIVRADPPLAKSKSSNHLKSDKAYITDSTAQRPVKLAPTRRTATRPHPGDDSNSPRAKKLAHAAERAKEIRERRRREPGVTPGEKRPPPAMSVTDGPGSKRTRISVVRD